MSIKLIAVDIDGTLLNSQRQVTPEVFQAIQDAKAAGVKVVIATGRPIPGVLPLLEELNLNQDGDYVITFNGGLVQETSTGNELIRETLSYEDYLDIEVLANKLGVHSHAITKDGIYTSNRNVARFRGGKQAYGTCVTPGMLLRRCDAVQHHSSNLASASTRN